MSKSRGGLFRQAPIADFSRREILGPARPASGDRNLSRLCLYVDRQSLSRELLGESDDGDQDAAEYLALSDFVDCGFHIEYVTY
jgi:hypothetical protein